MYKFQKILSEFSSTGHYQTSKIKVNIGICTFYIEEKVIKLYIVTKDNGCVARANIMSCASVRYLYWGSALTLPVAVCRGRPQPPSRVGRPLLSGGQRHRM